MALSRDLTISKKRRPIALVSFTGHGTQTEAVVRTHLLLVLGVENFVGKSQDIPDENTPAFQVSSNRSMFQRQPDGDR